MLRKNEEKIEINQAINVLQELIKCFSFIPLHDRLCSAIIQALQQLFDSFKSDDMKEDL
jgi:hypothetical protein